jgi:16S rRNA (uracil1498-N3)-methyltransferase
VPRIHRIYQPIELTCGALVQLDAKASHHIASVVRANVGDYLSLFNGFGGEYKAVIEVIHNKKIISRIEKFTSHEAESSLKLYLAQGISRNEKMDYIIQKAVELGVKKIIPLLTERCTIKLDEDRSLKRLQHWQSIIISACEQSGRNHLPELLPPMTMENALYSMEADWRFVLAPTASSKLKEAAIQPTQRVMVVIGPEGGLSEREITQACQQGFLPLNLGPRILRTETAAVAAITAVQCTFGDM